MSRIGRKPVPIIEKTKVDIANGHVTVTGPKGSLSLNVHPEMKVALDGSQLVVSRPSDLKKHRALHGLTRALIANMFLGLGMHRGPLLAYLTADPELSLQSILLVSAIIGRTKAWTYVAWVALFSTAAGLIFGSWVDGAGLGRIAAYLAGFLGVLALGLSIAGRRGGERPQPASQPVTDA